MLYVDDYNERQRKEQEVQQQDRENAIVAAYLNALWQRSKKMPKLKKVLADMKPKDPKSLTPQTPEQMLAAAMRWQARFERKGEG